MIIPLFAAYSHRMTNFAAAQDFQQSVQIRVCQGENKRFADNIPLGELRLDGLRSGKRGEVKIEVSFMIDADGIVQVSARDLETGSAESATLSVLGVGA